jgi:hypothetical protein
MPSPQEQLEALQEANELALEISAIINRPGMGELSSHIAPDNLHSSIQGNMILLRDAIQATLNSINAFLIHVKEESGS